MDNTNKEARSVPNGQSAQPDCAEESATSTEQSPADGAKDSCQPVGTFALDALREIAARAKAKG